jgi:predicted transcriptional regulator of viral defense system
MGTGVLPSGLPELFSYTDARRHGLSDRQIRNLSEQGMIERIGRGLFGTTTLDADPDLIEVAFRSERATMCLTSALARHGLTDEIPATIDLALPRGTRAPATSAPITWHKFDPKSFDLGREYLDVGAGYRIGLYSAERSICDAFRIRHLEGTDQAVEALKRWLRRPGNQPSQLLDLATAIGPKAAQPIRAALQILL